MSLVSKVRHIVDEDCLANRCLKNGCRLKLNDLPGDFLLIDMDHEKAPTGSQLEKKCDYIFVGDANNGAWVAPLELKRGKLQVSEVLPQLQAGAKIAERIVPRETQTRFRPIAVYGGELHTDEYSRLRHKRIQFFNQREPVRAVRSGSSLLSALGKP